MNEEVGVKEEAHSPRHKQKKEKQVVPFFPNNHLLNLSQVKKHRGAGGSYAVHGETPFIVT